MKIYLLWRARAENGSDVIGAFTSKELANEALEKDYRERYQEEYDGMLEHPVEGRAMIAPDIIDIDQIDEYFTEFDADLWIDDITLEGEINA